MRVVTTHCARFQHPEFVLDADESVVPEIYLKEMAETIEKMVAGGSVFQPDQTFQVGWMITRVVAHGAAQFSLVEPDMKAFPIKWVPGITQTLRQKMLQVFMLDSVGLRHEMNIPSIRQSLTACSQYSSADVFMSRAEQTDEQDSGWFVGCLKEDHDHNDPENLLCVSLYEALLNQRRIEGFVMFPIGSTIVMDQAKGFSIHKDDKEVKIVPGTLLDAWSKKQTR